MCSSMEETETESSYTKPEKLVTEENHENPSKFYNHFLYKAALVVVFFVILPLVPSQAPEFFNQSVLTRSWELLHLLLVGIAVSYGLFSSRNERTDKENSNTKFDSAHSYVSRFLQVSSVFDDETETPSVSDENKVQTWSSQYYRNEPVVVVAQEHSALDEQRATTSRIGEKPLLLPVRSLKQRVPDRPDNLEPVNESSANSGSLSRSTSRRFSSKSNKVRGGEYGGLDHQELEEKLKGSVVLPSPIPWRSRSGRLEVKDEVDSIPSPKGDSEFSRQESWGSRSQASRSSRSNSMSSSPKLSPSPSFSSPKKASPSFSLSLESQAKNVEDVGKKKSFYKSSPPPPPPPPPMFYKSSSLRPSKDGVLNEKDLMRSFSSETRELNRSNAEHVMGRMNAAIETNHRSYVDGLPIRNSVRTTRAGENRAGALRTGREMGEHGYVNGNSEKNFKEVEENLVEKAARKRVGFDETSFRTDRSARESILDMPNSGFNEFSEEDKEDFLGKSATESDEETESEDDNFEESFIQKDIGDCVSACGSASDGGPDVDKKADEFIAKFREQIRLQRIDSIKKSSAQISRNLSR